MFQTEHGGNIKLYSTVLNSSISDIIDFSANINPFGMHPKIKQAIINAIDSCENYPDPNCTELTNKLSKKFDVSPKNIVCGNGAADIIFRSVISIKPKKAVIVSPTFSEYQKALELAGCEVIYHALSEDNGFNFTMPETLDSSIDMLFICNPNNPTGVIYSKENMLELAEKCNEYNIILFVDECFIDFVACDSSSLVGSSLGNIIVLKAFTKMYSMAGVRLGYCICSESTTAEKIKKASQHWSVSSLAMSAGETALELEDYEQQTAIILSTYREYLISQLKKLGFTTYNSSANFIFFRSQVDNLQKKLAYKNIIIRSCANYVGLNDTYYRIAVKDLTSNKTLISCLRDICR